MAAAAEDAVVHECGSGTWWAACDAAVPTRDSVCASCRGSANLSAAVVIQARNAVAAVFNWLLPVLIS
eukprot:500077-Pelagomonas_calceolata.AAC.1